MSRPKALAIAGPGDSSLANTKELLNDLLGWGKGVPDDDDTKIIVISDQTLSAGMESVVDWIDEMEAAYDLVLHGDNSEDGRNLTGRIKDVVDNADYVLTNSNANRAAIDYLDACRYTHDLNLVLLWGEEGDENTEVLLDAASSLDVQTLDLTAGLDSITFVDEEAMAAPETPPEPVEEPTAASDPSPLEDARKPLEEAPETAPKPRKPKPEKPKPVADAPAAQPTTNFAEVEAAVEEEVKIREMFATLDSIIRELPGPLEVRVQSVARLQESYWWATRAVVIPELVDIPPADLSLYQSTLDRMEGMLSGEDTPKAEEEPSEAPAPKRGRGRPRTRRPTHNEFYDPEEGKWVRAGRGKRLVGYEYRTVDSETNEVIVDA